MTHCLICEVSANGLHFGVACCRACAAFFRRTNQLSLKYKCRFDGKCDVTHNNRYSCRHCRYNKCIAKGMNRSGAYSSHATNHIAPDENDIDKAVLSESFAEQSTSITFDQAAASSSSDRKQEKEKQTGSDQEFHSNIQVYIKARLDVLFQQPAKSHYFPYSIPLSLCQQAMVAYTNHTAMWPDCTPSRVREMSVLDMSVFIKMHYLEVEYVAQFCMSIQPFVQLPSEQKWLVFKHFWPRFIELDRTFVTCKILGTNTADERVVCHDGTVIALSCHVSRLEDISDVDVHEIKRIMQGTQDVFKSLFTIPFKKYNPDEFELMYMIMSTMWNIRDLEGATPETRSVSEHVRSRLSEDLYNYYTFELNRPNYAERIYKLSHLVTALDRINERRREDGHLSRTFNIFKHDIFLEGLR